MQDILKHSPWFTDWMIGHPAHNLDLVNTSLSCQSLNLIWRATTDNQLKISTQQSALMLLYLAENLRNRHPASTQFNHRSVLVVDR